MISDVFSLKMIKKESQVSQKLVTVSMPVIPGEFVQGGVILKWS